MSFKQELLLEKAEKLLSAFGLGAQLNDRNAKKPALHRAGFSTFK